MTTRQRAALRAMCNTMEPVLHIGKDGITDNLVKQCWDALEARELIKMKVLENSGEAVRDVAEELAAACGAMVVTVIGNKLVLYRQATDPKRRKIELP